jgi:hypothetical protein
MIRTFALALGLLTAAAAAPALAGSPPQKQAVSASTVVSVAPAARPIHAVLRYDATTAAACRGFSDDSSEVCLLLALHIIRLSEKPLPGGSL